MSIPVVIFLFLLSIFLAYRSFNNLKNNKEISEVKKDLKKGRVVFQKDSKNN